MLNTHLIGAMHSLGDLNIPAGVDSVIRFFARVTFVLYLTYYSLLLCYGRIINNGLVIVALVFVTVLALAP